MKGLELSEAFYETCGKPMLEEAFSHLLPFLAVGLIGSGSECFGYDDDISRDHDFEPGFCIFLPDESRVDRHSEFLLERAYAKLPSSFMGVSRSNVVPVGGARHGVLRTADFFMKTTGSPDGNLSLQQWLTIPEQALAEATNGRLFFDRLGEVSCIRNALSVFPEDIRLKRLSGHLLLMAQSGQYNYLRCLDHGEPAAAQLAVTEFVKSCISVIFLLNRRYQLYYKWVFRAIRDLPLLSELHAPLEYLLSSGNGPDDAIEKSSLIEELSAVIIDQLAAQKLTSLRSNDLERQAYSVNSRIKVPELRNMNILVAV
jgi:hypothetical protein